MPSMMNQDMTHSKVQKFSIDSEQAGQRIDNFLLNYLKNVPKTRIYKMLRKGEVRINGGRIKPLYRLKADDEIRIPPVHQTKKQPTPSVNLNSVKQLERSIIYESDRVLVINKPEGIAVHGGSGLSFGVIEAMRSIRSELKYLELVHRLDRATSGCLILAKRRSTLRFLHEQLREHRINKVYHALVAGHWDKLNTKVTSPLEKQMLKSGERISVVSDNGKDSCTLFKLLQHYKNTSLIEARPITGRTHQIRVHCASSGHPICGDSRYDLDNVSPVKSRLFLHAQSVTFKEKPDSDPICVESAKDEKWSAVIDLGN